MLRVGHRGGLKLPLLLPRPADLLGQRRYLVHRCLVIEVKRKLAQRRLRGERPDTRLLLRRLGHAQMLPPGPCLLEHLVQCVRRPFELHNAAVVPGQIGRRLALRLPRVPAPRQIQRLPAQIVLDLPALDGFRVQPALPKRIAHVRHAVIQHRHVLIGHTHKSAFDRF